MLARRGIVPDIGHHMLHPTFRLLAIKVLRALLTARNQPHDKVDQRFMQLGQIARFCNPMVHLDIYVSMVITVPRCVERIRPQALKVRRQQSRLRAAYQEVPAIVVVQCRQGVVTLCHVFTGCRVVDYSAVGSLCCLGAAARQ